MESSLLEIGGWNLVAPKEPLSWAVREGGPVAPGEARVRVVGCGVCHTDLGFAYDGVGTRHPLPLTLGHEIAGYVVEAGDGAEHLVGKAVIVPAVIPCGKCADCRAGQPMICKAQVFPGNDRHGGFATHVDVPAVGLCVVDAAGPDPDAELGGVAGLTLRHLAVIADAVSTPYQAVLRSGLQAGDLAIVVGLGGVGGYAAQLCKAMGAHVVGLDVNAERLATAGELGVGLALDPRSMDMKALKAAVRDHAKKLGAPLTRWKLFECSGSAPGQSTAFDLLVHGATLLVVGFTLDKVTVRLSNLMAFDAKLLGNWGCAPELYPPLVDLVLKGAIQLVPFTELRPLASLPQTFDDVHHHRASKRIVLVP